MTTVDLEEDGLDVAHRWLRIQHPQKNPTLELGIMPVDYSARLEAARDYNAWSVATFEFSVSLDSLFFATVGPGDGVVVQWNRRSYHCRVKEIESPMRGTKAHYTVRGEF